MAEYSADNIKVLEGLEAVRKRPGMYIGDTSERGLHHLVYEIVDNSIDEALAGHCDQIEVTIHIDNSVTVIDNGRGIPVDMHATEKKSAAEVVLTKLHAGGKFDKASYKVSGGLHGVGLSVVNALAEALEVEIKRDGKVYQQSYIRGVPREPLKEVGKSKERGTRVTFKPDGEIFETTEFSFDILSQRLRELAFLNRGVKITIEDERTQKKHEFFYKGGLLSFVEHLNRAKTAVHPKVVYFEGEKDGVAVEIAMQWNDGYSENVFSFANNINTIEGGTHLIGFKAALTRTINYYAATNGFLKKEGAPTIQESVPEVCGLQIMQKLVIAGNRTNPFLNGTGGQRFVAQGNLVFGAPVFGIQILQLLFFRVELHNNGILRLPRKRTYQCEKCQERTPKPHSHILARSAAYQTLPKLPNDLEWVGCSLPCEDGEEIGHGWVTYFS